jgi:hypothetical protein
MEAHGPITRHANLSPSDGRTTFDRSEGARNVSSKPAPARGARTTAPAPADDRNAAVLASGTAAAIGDRPHVVELSLDGRGSLLKEIVSLIGIERAARLVAAFGGMRLYVPHYPEPDDTLSELIGNAAACALARIYGGDRIDVPNPTPRRIQIIELRATGVSIDEIARSLRCTRRRVFQVLAEARCKQRLRKVRRPR